MKKFLYIASATLLGYGSSFAASLLQDDQGNGLSDTDLKSGDVSFDDIPSVILALTNNLLKFTGVISMVMIIVGAIVYSVSGVSGDKSKGQNIIFFAIIGALISWGSWFIINFVVDNI